MYAGLAQEDGDLAVRSRENLLRERQGEGHDDRGENRSATS